ncbi:MAG TPA: Calx-beta domain-containing protein [Thermoanaerobaculia bacterium]|nr:Calx-beta domain-containing protein [Thermoanaerobaculia bacterium]
MRRAAFAVLLFSAAALRAQSSCPTTAPRGFGARLNVCTADAPCLAGKSVLLPLTPIVPDCPAPPPGSPPPPSCTIYQLQACDRLTWDFGDGTPPMDGSMTTSHTYASPGVYHPSVTITNALGTAPIGIVDAVTIASNPQPTATVDDVRVSEGDGTADVVVRVSAPFGVPVLFQALPADGTATNNADYAGTPSCVLRPGDTQCVMSIPIVDDDVAESDEFFTVRVEKQYSPVGPRFLRDTATITIVDDDAARIVVAAPASLIVLAGTHGTVTVSMQPSGATAQTVALSSTRPEVAAVAASLTIPAGGSATLDIHALAPGTAKISIGSSFSVDVTVAVPRRRAAR